MDTILSGPGQKSRIKFNLSTRLSETLRARKRKEEEEDADAGKIEER